MNALQSGSSEDGAVPGMLFYFAQTGIHISTKVFDLMIRITIQPLRNAPYASGSNRGVGRKILKKISVVFVNKNVFVRRSFKYCRLLYSLRQLRGHIFH